jgi:hypothetical protein
MALSLVLPAPGASLSSAASPFPWDDGPAEAVPGLALMLDKATALPRPPMLPSRGGLLFQPAAVLHDGSGAVAFCVIGDAVEAGLMRGLAVHDGPQFPFRIFGDASGPERPVDERQSLRRALLKSQMYDPGLSVSHSDHVTAFRDRLNRLSRPDGPAMTVREKGRGTSHRWFVQGVAIPEPLLLLESAGSSGVVFGSMAVSGSVVPVALSEQPDASGLHDVWLVDPARPGRLVALPPVDQGSACRLVLGDCMVGRWSDLPPFVACSDAGEDAVAAPILPGKAA